MAPPPRPNLTGFDVRKYVQAAGSPANDPWKRMETWRTTGPFSRFNRFKGALPGLGTATVAFAAYCAYEYMFLSKDDHGHGHADANSGDEHH